MVAGLVADNAVLIADAPQEIQGLRFGPPQRERHGLFHESGAVQTGKTHQRAPVEFPFRALAEGPQHIGNAQEFIAGRQQPRAQIHGHA